MGLIFDLGPHLIDQALDLFGVPQKITAFLQNIRGIGDAAVDDTVSPAPAKDSGQNADPLAFSRAQSLRSSCTTTGRRRTRTR